jgi:hypothetical protein
MRYRLRTLLIAAIVGPPLLAGTLLYGERTWNEIRRWWIRQQQPPPRQNIVPPTPAPPPQTTP